jgi:hypothetical protein
VRNEESTTVSKGRGKQFKPSIYREHREWPKKLFRLSCRIDKILCTKYDGSFSHKDSVNQYCCADLLLEQDAAIYQKFAARDEECPNRLDPSR